MVSIEGSPSYPGSSYIDTPPPSSARISRSMGRSMRTVRSKIFQTEFANDSCATPRNSSCSFDLEDFLGMSGSYSDLYCSSDISAELRQLATAPDHGIHFEPEPSSEFLQRERLYSEIIASVATEFFQPTVKICVDELQSTSPVVKRSAAGKLRLLAKSRSDNRALIGDSGAIPALIPLLICSDPASQEQAATALLNLSLHERNRPLITNAGAVKSLIHALKTGTAVSKQNAACALLNLAQSDETKLSIGACGAIPPLVSLLVSGSSRGKKDALATLYKLCSVRLNKQRAVRAGAVRALVAEKDRGLAEKIMAVLSSLSGTELGRKAIVEEGGIAALLEAIESGTDKGKEFAVWTLLQLCRDNADNIGFVLREWGIPPPLLTLSLKGTSKAKNKAKVLIRYLKEPELEASSSSDP
ncbi:U-box domain-containing protein 4-like [Dorcoceras hygrometricum]|uniref:U-box domain-containing protein 4-like n=1 Tax=Dorcoceras hygrometricum TaxID=472368 RepID=A0A2Z7AAS1_9LAMI|nr:U-box domain-containing protein 4-like [Dorcoceras hygrometricum]